MVQLTLTWGITIPVFLYLKSKFEKKILLENRRWYLLNGQKKILREITNDNVLKIEYNNLADISDHALIGDSVRLVFTDNKKATFKDKEINDFNKLCRALKNSFPEKYREG